MTRSEIQAKIRLLREELENRHKYGTIKMADANGTPISTEAIQKEMYSLIYKMSKAEL